MRKIILILIAMMFIQTTSAYGTGYLNISSYKLFSQYELPAGAAGAALDVDLNKAYVAYPTYTTVYDFRFKNDQCTFPYPANTTTFTVTSGATTATGGTVNGVVSYDTTASGAAHNEIRWLFSDTAFLTSDLVTFSYTDPGIFTTFSCAGATTTKVKGVLSSSEPMALGVNGAIDTISDSYNGIKNKYSFAGAASSVNTWNITYYGGNTFAIQVHKDDKASWMYLYNESSISYYKDSGYNTNDFGWFGNNTGQIVLNGTLSTGGYNSIIINNSGQNATIYPTPTTLITPTVNPTYGIGISWGKTNYSLGETGTLSWVIESSIFDFISDFNIKITDMNGNTVKDFHNLGTTGNAQYQFPSVGVYTASFYKSICVLGICSNDFKGSSSASVSLSPSYIFITSPVVSGVSFNASYIFGNTIIHQGELNSVIIEQFTDGGLSSYSTTSLNNFNIISGNSYNVSLIVGSPGKYKATLFDVSRGRIADVNFDAVVGFIPPQANITSSYVTTDKLSYFFSESIIASYVIDNINYTNGSLSKYFAIKNNDKNLYVFITPNSIGWPLTEQVDTFEVPINSGSEDVPCQTNKNCFKFNSNTIFYPGSTSIELHAKTNNTDRILAFGNFTINQIDSDGYGLFLSKSNTCVNDPVVITVSSPINSTVQIIEHSNVADNIVFSEWGSSGNNKTTTRRFFHTGTYEVNLIDQSANTRFNRYITVNSKYCTVTPTPTTPPVTASGTTSQITNFLTSNLFWALVMIVGFMLAIAYKERKGN